MKIFLGLGYFDLKIPIKNGQISYANYSKNLKLGQIKLKIRLEIENLAKFAARKGFLCCFKRNFPYLLAILIHLPENLGGAGTPLKNFGGAMAPLAPP